MRLDMERAKAVVEGATDFVPAEEGNLDLDIAVYRIIHPGGEFFGVHAICPLFPRWSVFTCSDEAQNCAAAYLGEL
ncbi:hypothetical protein [Radicibacter daui]|uniref:hypothetical protein n=1 Tax=Radicibacter daui TaxID=3064829 RepID=UPI004046A3EA